MSHPPVRIYHFPNTRSARPVWCAHEVGAEVELVPVNLRAGEHKQPAYLALHPLGKVPAAEVDGVPVFESGAICQVLAERAEGGFLPAERGARARCLSLSWFAVGELDGPTIGAALELLFKPEGQRDEARLAKARELWTGKVTPWLSGVLGGQAFLMGETLTLADVMVGYTAVYAQMLGVLDDNLAAWVGRLRARPGFQAAFQLG